MGRPSTGLLVVLVMMQACATESSDAPGITVRDSAGVRVVENTVSPDDVPVYADLGEADLTIGVMEGDPVYSFANLLDVRTLPDGELIVVEAQSQELRVFDSGGRFVRTIGRQGEGPGEFGRLAKLADVEADTVWTWDSRLSRLTWFRTDGDLLGDRRLMIGDFLVAELTRLADGTHLAALVNFAAANDAERFYVAPEPLMLLDADGEPVDSLRNVGGLDMMVTRSRSDNGRTMVMITPVPLGRGTSYATSADRVYTGWNGEYRIVARTLSGTPSMVILALGLQPPLDAAEVAALRERRMESCPTETCEQNVRTLFDDFERPERRPAFSAFEVDADDNLWVAEYVPTDEPATGWHVFSPEGELLGHVTVPSRLTVHEIGSDYILGVQENELDVPFVRRFPLTRLR